MQAKPKPQLYYRDSEALGWEHLPKCHLKEKQSEIKLPFWRRARK